MSTPGEIGRHSDKLLRVHERYPANWQADLRCESWAMVEHLSTVNVSKGGMFLRSKQPPEIGTTVQITLHLPDGDRLVLRGVVRHVKLNQGTGPGAPTGIGVEVDTRHRNELRALTEIARLRQGKRPEPTGEHPRSPTPAVGLPAGKIAEIVGIDLGVSSTGIGVAIGGAVFMVPDRLGRSLVPSVVSYPEGQPPVIGWEARQARVEYPDRTVFSIKRLLGRRFSDDQIVNFLRAVPFKTSAGPEDAILIDIGEDHYAVPQVCAMIIAHLRKMAESRLGRPVLKAVLTHPVTFQAPHKEALARSAKIAGIDVVALVEEPVAAALAFGHGQAENERVAVFDFGGGTLDFTLVEISAQRFRVLVSEGDDWLGGDDFDWALAEAVANTFWRQTQIEVRNRAVEWQRLLLAAEHTKRRLSRDPEAKLVVSNIVEVPKPVDLEQAVDRETFERVTHHLVQQSLELCTRAMGAVGVKPQSVDRLVVTGGTTRIPYLRAQLEQLFGQPLAAPVRADEAVGLGAGLYAARVARHPARVARSRETIG
jgi:molecular chaperone DnaK